MPSIILMCNSDLLHIHFYISIALHEGKSSSCRKKKGQNNFYVWQLFMGVICILLTVRESK